MKPRITIRSARSGRRYKVRSDIARMIASEILLAKRTRRSRARLHFAVDAEATISVHRSGKARHYELVGRTHLQDKSTQRYWTFYLGLLIVEWLEQAEAPAAPGSPYPGASVPFLTKIP